MSLATRVAKKVDSFRSPVLSNGYASKVVGSFPVRYLQRPLGARRRKSFCASGAGYHRFYRKKSLVGVDVSRSATARVLYQPSVFLLAGVPLNLK